MTNTFEINWDFYIKFMFPRKATKFDEIFTADMTLCCKCQNYGEDLFNFCGLLRKRDLYLETISIYEK